MNLQMIAGLKRIAESAYAVRVSKSAAWDCFTVACGRADARVFHATKHFDFAAASVLVKEGGALRVASMDYHSMNDRLQ